MDHGVDGEKPGGCQEEAERATTDQAARLPEDVLADVLRHLAPRGLGASRCVCKAWRDVIDGRRLLRTELLPLWVGGIFINFHNYYITELFSRPSGSRPTISGKHNYLPGTVHDSWSEVCDQCNGLLLVEGYNDQDGLDLLQCYVLNPATLWYAPLPPLSVLDPPPNTYRDPYKDIRVYDKYLVYNPTASLHYKVFLIQRFYAKLDPRDIGYQEYKDNLDPVIEQSEWPPSPCILHVFSSRTGQWEERSFVREGEAAGTITDMRQGRPYANRNAVYWRGALYVHGQTDFVMRLSLSNRTYQIIKTPEGINEVHYCPQFYLGKSKYGVYCAQLYEWYCLRVWILKESGNQIEWALRHETNLHGLLLKNNIGSFAGGPWILQNINCHDFKDKNKTMEQVEGDKFEWSSEVSSDEDSTWDKDHKPTNTDKYCGYLGIIGFHPYKEIIFLSESIKRGLAYHFNSSKIQVLGDLYPATYDRELSNERLIKSSLPYTPCWL